jgi:hypothetical protein
LVQGRLARFLHGSFRVFSVVALPFVALVRGSVLFYRTIGLPSSLAISLAAAIALGILTLYGAWLSRKFDGQSRTSWVARWVALPVVLCYCGYALIFLARANAKTDAVRSTYLSTQPVLRVALSTVILFDRDLVVTDLGRTPDDYRRMGLPVRESSLHYPQKDGWVHAVDIRTSGRPFAASVFLWIYFRSMGFDTLWHRGTADHLHVDIPLN